jgi:GT2 family glycosyltransferase
MIMKRKTITVLVCHTPIRPVDCLIRTLDSISRASQDCSVNIEVVVQGPCPKGHELPPPGFHAGSDVLLKYIHNERNTGVAEPLTRSVERWLGSGGDYWAKVDDDVILAEGSFDTMLLTIDLAQKRGHKVGCVHMNIGDTRPVLLKATSGVLDYVPGQHEKLPVTWGDIYVIDFVGTGATIFTKTPFDEGCQFDDRYKIGGVDVDMAWQMTQKGIRSILMTRPRSKHDLGNCSPNEYVKVRWNPDEINKSGRIFKQKWGLSNNRLKR